MHDIIHDMNRETAMLHISRICQWLQSLSLGEKSNILQRSIFIQKDLQLNWECPAPHSPWAVLQDRWAWGGGTRCTSPRWSQRTQAGWKIKFSEWVQTIDVNIKPQQLDSGGWRWFGLIAFLTCGEEHFVWSLDLINWRATLPRILCCAINFLIY